MIQIKKVFLIYYYCTTCFVRCSALSDLTQSLSHQNSQCLMNIRIDFTFIYTIWENHVYIT